MIKPNIQIDGLVREMTDEDYETYLADQEFQETLQAEQDARTTARQSALNKLAALGLTEEEIEAL